MTEQQAKALDQEHRQYMHAVTADMAAMAGAVLGRLLVLGADADTVTAQIAAVEYLEQEAARCAT